jgi:hypothetical protein
MLRCWSFDMNTLAPNSASFWASEAAVGEAANTVGSPPRTSHRRPAWDIPCIVGSHGCRCVGAAPATPEGFLLYIG